LDVTGGDYQVGHAAAKEVAEDMSRTIDQVMASARADVEALIQRHTAAIEQVSRALLAARWHEMDGEEASTILARVGVERANVRGDVPDYPPGISSHGHCPQRDAAHGFGFERKDGLVVRARHADPLRVAYLYERRADGCFV
jgi:hypothetical protein